jgi:hypothetical protein
MKRELKAVEKLEAIKAMLGAFGYTNINLTVEEAFDLFEVIDEQLASNLEWLDAHISNQDM